MPAILHFAAAKRTVHHLTREFMFEKLKGFWCIYFPVTLLLYPFFLVVRFQNIEKKRKTIHLCFSKTVLNRKWIRFNLESATLRFPPSCPPSAAPSFQVKKLQLHFPRVERLTSTNRFFFFGWTFKRLEKRWVLFFFQVSSSDLSEVGISFFESSLLREESAVPKRLSVR